MLRFIDGFDHVDAAHVPEKWLMGNGLTGVGIAAGRYGAFALSMTQANSISKQFDGRVDWFWGGSILWNGQGEPFMTLANGTGTLIALSTNGSGQIQVANRTTTLHAANSAVQVPTNVWCTFEIYVLVSNSGSATGQVIINIDGQTRLNLTSVDTSNGVNNTQVNTLTYCGGGGPSNIRWDDLYIADSTGSRNNTFVGLTKVITVFPNANGSVNNFAFTGAGNAFSAVNENPPNGDTSYISSNNNGDVQTFVFDTIVDTSIHAVQATFSQRKDDAGFRKIQPVVRASGTVFPSGVDFLPYGASNYLIGTQIMETNPATSNSWSKSDINNDEFGIKVTA